MWKYRGNIFSVLAYFIRIWCLISAICFYEHISENTRWISKINISQSWQCFRMALILLFWILCRLVLHIQLYACVLWQSVTEKCSQHISKHCRDLSECCQKSLKDSLQSPHTINNIFLQKTSSSAVWCNSELYICEDVRLNLLFNKNSSLCCDAPLGLLCSVCKTLTAERTLQKDSRRQTQPQMFTSNIK